MFVWYCTNVHSVHFATGTQPKYIIILNLPICFKTIAMKMIKIHSLPVTSDQLLIKTNALVKQKVLRESRYLLWPMQCIQRRRFYLQCNVDLIVSICGFIFMLGVSLQSSLITQSSDLQLPHPLSPIFYPLKSL